MRLRRGTRRQCRADSNSGSSRSIVSNRSTGLLRKDNIGRRLRDSIGKRQGWVGRSGSRMVIRGRARGLRIRVADMGTRVIAGGSDQRTTMARRLRRGILKTG